MRLRFHGRLVDGFILERRTETDHVGKLAWLDRVVSPEAVLTPEIRRLVDAVAARYAGTRADVLRLAVPPRHAKVERENRTPPEHLTVDDVDRTGWEVYSSGGQFLTALAETRAARAVWQALPGELWADRFAEAAAQTVQTGRAVLAIVPDQRDVDAMWRAATGLIDEGAVVALSAGLGPSARYRRWLAALRGSARLVIGTRSAVFAPVSDLGLVMVWDDGDDTLAEPRAPYPHAREVAMLRAHQMRCAAVIGGYARTAEAQALVRSGWAHDVVAARPVVRARTPRVVALDDGGYADERDPAARTARLPSVALRAARTALQAETPVLVQVPRRGYVPSLACARCRAIARCRHCTGPLSLEDRGGTAPVCRWCGRVDEALRCSTCGSDAVRAVVVGARRTAEELGRAFRGHNGDHLRGRDGGVRGRRPTGVGGGHTGRRTACRRRIRRSAAAGQLGAARSSGSARRRGHAAALDGRRGVGAISGRQRGGGRRRRGIHPHGAIADPLGSRRPRRRRIGGPRRGRVAAMCAHGRPRRRRSRSGGLLAELRLPDTAELLGPVPLPPGARRPPGVAADEPVSRMLVRVNREQGLALAGELRRGVAVVSARQTSEPVRVQIDPLQIG